MAIKTPFLIGLCALSAVFFGAGASVAETIAMKAELKASNEVPPVNSPGAGSAEVTYDTASKKVSWKVTFSGLSGNPTAAHFHGPAEPGRNAGVAVPIANIGTSPAEGSATLNDAQQTDLLAGRYYINIHTAANPAGEIRGQVVK